MGGSQPSPPTLDTNQSKALTQADYDLKQKNTPGLVETTGKAGREEYARNIAFALRGFTDPSSIYQGDIEDLRERRKKAQGQLDALTGARQSSNQWGKTYLVGGKWIGERDYKKRVSALQSKVARSTSQIQRLRNSDPVKNLQGAFRSEFKMRDNLLGQMRGAQKSSAEYNRMQRALQKGTKAQTVVPRTAAASRVKSAQAKIVDRPTAVRAQRVANVKAGRGQAAQADLTRGQAAEAGMVDGPNATMAQAAQMGDVANVASMDVAASRMGDFGRATSRDISAGQVDAGALGQTLMGRAIQMAQSDGQLSAQAERDAVQSARQGMAARGMATGSAALGAELLNRDRYSRQRQFEDLEFAQGVQGQDLQRQFQNVGNQLAAAQANQGAAMQAELANLQARYNAAVQNGNWEQAAAIQNQSANLESQMANQQIAFSTGQFNAANQQQANLANQSAANQMALAGYQGAIDQRQFNAANQQAMNLANMQAANQMSQFNATNRQDMRQFNLGQALQASMANQSAANQRSLANQAAINQMRTVGYEGSIRQRQAVADREQAARIANQNAINNMRQFNVTNLANRDQFNALQRTDAQRFNVGMLQSSALAADNERARQLGLGQSAYNFALQTNPKMMLAGLGSPYANFTPQALGLMSNTNVQPIYSGGSPGTAGQNMMLAGTLGGGALVAGGTIAGAVII